jgi:hypothetical protein
MTTTAELLGAELAEVKADDTLLDHLTDHLDDELVRLLVGWRREVRAGAAKELIDTGAAVSMITAVRRGALRPQVR